MFQGATGQDHRKQIFRLVGIRDSQKNTISVNQVSQPSHRKPDVMIDDILGRIGRHFLSHSKNSGESKINSLVLLYEEMNIEADHGKRRMKDQAFSDRWEKLEIVDRNKLVGRLFVKGLLPNVVKQALDTFEGEVVSLV